MTYQLVAADLDGTLRAERQPFTPRVLAAVRSAQERGVHVVMATGRMFGTAVPFARELDLRSPIVCNHGATIHDWEKRTLLFERTVPLDLARRIVRWTPDGISVVVCLEDEFFSPRSTPYVERFADGYHQNLHIDPNLAETLYSEPQKIVFVNDVDVTDRLYGELIRMFGTAAQVVRSFSQYNELTHPAVSKGKAIEWLANRWGIDQEQVIAIGDQDNDRSMVEWAGMGVAMGNAIESLKNAADYVAPTASDDGAAYVIERFVLNA
jgi:Cof subfamily protein (haloacid dehalogenase superfamily)